MDKLYYIKRMQRRKEVEKKKKKNPVNFNDNYSINRQ